MKKNIGMNLVLKILFFIFLVNFLWEISQMFLYANHTNNFLNFIFVHIKASLGDVIIFMLIYALEALILQNKKWILREDYSAYALTIFLGFVIAVVIEKYALTTNRWSYNALMPIIPFLNVGLTPVLQMLILPAFTISIFKRSLK